MFILIIYYRTTTCFTLQKAIFHCKLDLNKNKIFKHCYQIITVSEV